MRDRKLPDNVMAMWEYYQRGNSAREVAKRFQTTVVRVELLFVRSGLQLRSQSEAAKLRHARNKNEND